MERRPINSSAEGKGWKNIEIQGSEYIISTSAGKKSWKVSLSNLIEIWTETITEETALARCQSLNVLLDLESFNVEETLNGLLNDIPKYAIDISENEIKLQTDIDNVPFKFNIELTKGNALNFWNEITRPLCRSSIELQRRHKIILDLIKKKDEEILEYKLSGAELSRRKVETLPYNDEIFKDGVSIAKEEREECVNAFQWMMQLYGLKKLEPSLIGESRSLTPAELGIKTEIQDPDEISETTSEFNVNGIKHHSEIETGITMAGSSAVKHQKKDDEDIMNNDQCKTDSGIKTNPKKQSVFKIVANVPTGSKEQVIHKKLKKDSDIYKIIR